MFSTKTLFILTILPQTLALTGLGDNIPDGTHRILRWAAVGGYALLGLRIFGVIK